jgi:hypothetical protein
MESCYCLKLLGRPKGMGTRIIDVLDSIVIRPEIACFEWGCELQMYFSASCSDLQYLFQSTRIDGFILLHSERFESGQHQGDGLPTTDEDYRE